ncbi:MAG: alpha/beta fold hydrolase [Elusimicrobia bacterium]|nr:alpha/beta fold hydrolase [Elusimicrobiota bacterium]
MDLFFRDEGPRSGLSIVLIHGFPFDHTMWRPQVQALKNHFRVVTYDVRGLGRSPLAGASATMESYVDDLFGLLDLLGLPAVALCGLSMGGYIALRAAERAPQRLQALILADTRSGADTEQARDNRIASIRGIEKDGLKPFADEFIKKAFAPRTLAENRPCVTFIRDTILRSDPQGVCASAAAIMSRTDTTPALARIRVPTLVVGGEDDALTPPASCQALASAIPGARFARIPDAGHLSSIENPRAFNRQMLEFLRSLPD